MTLYLFKGSGLVGLLMARSQPNAARLVRERYGTIRGPFETYSPTLSELRRAIDARVQGYDQEFKPLSAGEIEKHAWPSPYARPAKRRS